MYNNYDYPAGADTPDAPWNEQETPEKDFDVTISQSLSKDLTVTTNNYVLEIERLDPEDGGEVEYANTIDTDWKEVYKVDHYTPLELIEILRDKYLKERLDVLVRDQKQFKADSKTYRDYEHDIKYYRYMIEECSNWVEDELDVTD